MENTYKTFDSVDDVVMDDLAAREPNGKAYHEETSGKKPSKGTYTIGDAIEHIGFGRFQVKLSLICGFAWIADSMEIMILGMLGPVLVCEWGLDPTREALTTMVVFCGFLIGSPALGIMADVYGRRLALVFCTLWAFYFGVLSGIAPTYAWILILRSLTGVGIAGTSQVITYYSEFLPVKSRGKCIIMQQIFWCFGGMIEVLLALAVLETVGWRWWMISSASPLFIFVLLCSFLPKSPRYEMACGRVESADQIIRQIARENKGDMPEGTISPEKMKPRGKVTELFNAEYRRTTILLLCIWTIAAFSYYGIILLSTELIRLPNTCLTDGLDVVAKEAGTCPLECKAFAHSDYMQLLWTSAAELPGLVLAAGLVDSLGRLWTLRLLFLLFTASCCLLFICMSHTLLVILLFASRALISAAFQACYVYTPEVYPTEVRALSMGMFSAGARVGALITPFVAQVLLRKSALWGVGVYATGGLIAALATFLLHIETKDRDLQESE